MAVNHVKTFFSGVFLVVLLVSMFSLVLDVNAQSASSNLLDNAGFEGGSLAGWNITGPCSVSSGIVHSGSYAAYLSDRSFDSMLNQTVMLPATDVLYAEGWVYPTQVGNMGYAFAPSAQVNFYFKYKSSMENAFSVGVVWCWCDAHLVSNDSVYLALLMPFNASSWNYFNLNLTEAVHSHFTGANFSDIVLYSIVAWYHYSNGSPGAFYVDDLSVSSEQPSSPLSPKPAAVSLGASAESTELGYILDFDGALTTFEGEPLAGKQVILSYMITGTAVWNPFSSVITDGNGVFSASWIPTATGNFMVKAEWQGDANYPAACSVKNVSVLRGSKENVFLAESNSTLSSLSLNSTSNEINFAVSGPAGTTGYVRFLLPNYLLQDPNSLKVYKDGALINYTVSTVGNQAVLYIVYSHSSHEMRISLPEYIAFDGSENSSSGISVILSYVFAFAVVAAVVSLTLFIVVSARKPNRNQ